jgi:hypothetical protein
MFEFCIASIVSPVTYKTRSPALDNKNLPLRNHRFRPLRIHHI